eukprot:CAMPEP_0115393162 /NCGR_PEP_ID=MMETSP0271-20121206/11604_1 /TAXON_ID=71861 /ORGANISM="Scrippsiella trochoidea, Strain CCMP3099" /LENGTH=53 /DNA_ID=CAMNT_0002816785 /DNA_START=142 /DNA_END=299 /DNA_ORIENTATION=-
MLRRLNRGQHGLSLKLNALPGACKSQESLPRNVELLPREFACTLTTELHGALP